MTDPVLEVSALTKTFGRVRAVDDVSFTLGRGGSLGIVGESGSGKTTTARIIVGLERADRGSVRIADGSAEAGAGVAAGAGRARHARRLAKARAIQMVFQDPYLSLDPRITIGEALREPLRLHFPGADHRARVAELLDQVGLGPAHAERLPKHLSGGQRQRVAIARALAVEPQVLVLDEAVVALDVSVQAQILNLLADIREQTGISYLFITHDLAVVRCVTDEIVVMRRGAIVEAGPTEAVLDNPAHAYTKILMNCVPRPGWDPEALTAGADV